MADKVVPNTEPRISADSHMAEPVDLWQERMPAKYKDRAFSWPGQRIGSGQYRREGGWEPAPRLKDMAADGVVADVLYPTRAKSAFRLDYEPEISEAAARVYNDWLIEFCSEAPDRLWGQALLPLFNIENAIEEMERCKKAGFVGVTTWMVPPDGLRFGSEHYDRFWAAAQDMEMPVSMHINNGYGPYAEASAETRTRNEWNRLDELTFTAAGHKKIAADMLTDIICSGVLERYPRLKIIVAEAEVGWIPFWLEEMDKRQRRHNSLPLLPSEYFYRQCYATFADDPVRRVPALPLGREQLPLGQRLPTPRRRRYVAVLRSGHRPRPRPPRRCDAGEGAPREHRQTCTASRSPSSCPSRPTTPQWKSGAKSAPPTTQDRVGGIGTASDEGEQL